MMLSFRSQIEAFDRFWLQAIAELRSPVANRIAADITSLGSMTVISIEVIIASLLLIYLAHRRRAALQLIVAVGGAELIVEIVKPILRRARPDVVEPLTQAFGYAFPSGHTTTSTALYLTLAMILAPWLQRNGRMLLAVVFALVTLLIGFSRIYLGLHSPSDVAAGLVLGTLWSLAVRRIVRLSAETQRDAQAVSRARK
jgi:undecaprenyl-diphosphatase